MMVGRQANLVVLSDTDRTFLEAQVRRHKAPRSLSDRCRMVLLCAQGLQSKSRRTPRYPRAHSWQMATADRAPLH
jgi:hypothetical protein